MKYFIGIIVIIIGSIMVIKTGWLLSWFGRVGWAERNLGTEGGSNLFYKLLGIIIILCSFLAMSGLLGSMIRDTLGPLFGVFKATPGT